MSEYVENAAKLCATFAHTEAMLAFYRDAGLVSVEWLERCLTAERNNLDGRTIFDIVEHGLKVLAPTGEPEGAEPPRPEARARPSEERDLLRSISDALPEDAEDVWRALGYDPDGIFGLGPPHEYARLAVQKILRRWRLVVGDRENLSDPPGPLCLGCDDLLPDGRLLVCDETCASEARERGAKELAS